MPAAAEVAEPGSSRVVLSERVDRGALGRVGRVEERSVNVRLEFAVSRGVARIVTVNMGRRTFGVSGGFGGGGTRWVCGLRGVLLARCSAGAGDTALWVGLVGFERRPGMDGMRWCRCHD